MTTFSDRPISHWSRVILIACLAGLFSLFPDDEVTRSASAPQSSANTCTECHLRANGRAREVVALHLSSSHAKISCKGCHSGAADESDKTKAHSGSFVGRPDATATLKMCAQCHEAPLVQFREGRHFPAHRALPRMDCVTCHGAHTVGAPPESFSFAQFCAACHGLEYLPEIPKPLQSLLALSDELREALRSLEARAQSKQLIPVEVIQGRKDIRRRISEIVHPTDLKSGLEKIPTILEDGRLLKEQIGKVNSKGE